MSDANLRTIFKSNLATWHWQPVETWSTGQGVPDAEFCAPPRGVSGWIENKKTSSNMLDHPPSAEQVAWLERRVRAGGRCFVAVRLQSSAGPRKGEARDELHLFPGAAARALLLEGLSGARALGVWTGSPRRWDWREVAEILTS